MTEQRAIAHILGTLDGKIELNRKMNETLEAMARALFQCWFVDFEPVRAKAEGHDPGLPKPIADLFPDRFEDSDLGRLPMGWTVGPILEQARLLSGGTPKTDRREYWGGGLPWASAKDVSQCAAAFLVATERTITQQGLQESATQLIPALSTVVVARGATTGRMVMLGREMAMNQTCYALATMRDTPFALYCQIRHRIRHLVHAAHGSVFDTITTGTFASSPFVLPPASVLAGFERLVSPVFDRVLSNCKESVSLGAVRDTLLPKLISGELRVKAVDRMAARATA
jgi:type I restriction enzyme S subunit